MKTPKLSTFSYDFMIPGSWYVNLGIWGLENLSKSRDFVIGIIPGLNTSVDHFEIWSCEMMPKSLGPIKDLSWAWSVKLHDMSQCYPELHL